ncbi:MAG: hypothetical protein V1865_00420 [bacterium]
MLDFFLVYHQFWGALILLFAGGILMVIELEISDKQALGAFYDRLPIVGIFIAIISVSIALSFFITYKTRNFLQTLTAITFVTLISIIVFHWDSLAFDIWIAIVVVELIIGLIKRFKATN